jgi:hypothetical protein
VILPASVMAWPEAALEDLEERSALIADGCRLPQRCEEADRRAEAIVRAKWEGETGASHPLGRFGALPAQWKPRAREET